MIKTKQIAVFAVGLAFVVALIPTYTHAQSPATKKPLTEAQCTLAKDKVAAHLTAYSAHHAERINAYKAITNRMNTFISSSTEAEYTLTAQLTTARDSYERAVTIYKTQADTYQASLEKVQSAQCGADNTSFKNALAIAQADLKKLRENSVSVKTAVKQNIVPALLTYADWLKTSNASTEETK